MRTSSSARVRTRWPMAAPPDPPVPPPDPPVPPPTLGPAVRPFVTLGLTGVYTAFYALLFLFVYAQLWLVLRYRHKRVSFQTGFLFLCLVWAALRTLLFSFYFRNSRTVNSLGPVPFWSLYCLPVCLQFWTLSLMNLYCAQVGPGPGPGPGLGPGLGRLRGGLYESGSSGMHGLGGSDVVYRVLGRGGLMWSTGF
uniref:Integral membrane protein GPR137 n=1 Tax=Sphaeramia orbicularis TaxID=375764 RepID=A0A673CGF0_9TELE